MKNHLPEILSPVGSFDSLRAAINAGADAIYFGVEQLNMRTRSSDAFSIVTGPLCGMVKDKANILRVNGIESEEAKKGDKLTFPFETKVTANDKLYKIIEAGHA